MASIAYSFLDVVGSIAGPGGSFSIGSSAGVAEEGITISFSDDRDTMTIGADGAVMHSLHANKSGTVHVRLLKTSPYNQTLSNMFNYQSGSAANWGGNTITIRNPVSGDSWTATACAFRKHPDGAYAKDGNILEWEFNAGIITPQIGNGAPSL